MLAGVDGTGRELVRLDYILVESRCEWLGVSGSRLGKMRMDDKGWG